MSEFMNPARPMSVPLQPAQPVQQPMKPVLKIGPEQLRKANLTLIKYKNGKAMLEKRLIANEKWWEARGWTEMQEQGNPSNARRPTQWLFNVVMGKHADMIEAYQDKTRWNRMSLCNIAAAGYFAADRSIGEYAENIWHVPYKK